ncbi:DUF4367 domain-containing protein [uncultured Methanolobus sp.]|uniref:DUF4367 domain-containing protein n=1 Tax=uncultured Methanolobus sp. TaxID=218300 RepID=UPI002AAC2CA0|nr:DUF4367 domain-containing protein [uncultured Methanolobus sp.]
MAVKLLVTMLLIGVFLIGMSYSVNRYEGGIFPPQENCNITFEQAQQISNNSIMIPSYLPEGYEMQSMCLVNGTSSGPDFSGYSQLTYTSVNGAFFVEEDFSGTKEFTFEAPASDDDVKVEKLTIGDHEGELRILHNETRKVSWDADGIRISVSSHNLEKNELVRIAESVN